MQVKNGGYDRPKLMRVSLMSRNIGNSLCIYLYTCLMSEMHASCRRNLQRVSVLKKSTVKRIMFSWIISD